MRKLFALTAVLVLITAACKIETNIGAIINADGSGTIVAEIGFDDEAAEMFLQGEDPFDGADFADAPGAQTREERRGDMTYYIVEVDVDDVTQMENELLGADNSLLSDLSIDVTDERVTVTGSATAEEGLGGEAEGFDPEMIEDSISASVYFTMPGQILSHNADRQTGNTLYWDIPVLGGTLDIQAESDPTGTPAGGGDGFPVWAYAVLAAVVLGAAWYFMKGRSGGTGGSDGAAAAPSAPTEEAPPAPPPLAE